MNLTPDTSRNELIEFDAMANIGRTVSFPQGGEIVISSKDTMTLYRDGNQVADASFNHHPGNIKAALSKLWVAA